MLQRHLRLQDRVEGFGKIILAYKPSLPNGHLFQNLGRGHMAENDIITIRETSQDLAREH
jgi:hypothetical protein